MKSKTGKLLSAILTLAMVFSLFAVMPITASALSWSESATFEATMVITDGDDVSEIEDLIGDLLNGTNNSGENVSFDEYDCVIVTGGKTNVDDNLEITIPAGKLVIWDADYITTDPCDVEYLIYLGGTGTFMVAGGILDNKDILGSAYTIFTFTTPIVVQGGEINASGYEDSNITIYSEATVTLIGGTVTANTGTAIKAAEIKVDGTANVSNNGDAYPAIYITGSNKGVSIDAGNLTVTGDIVSDNGDGIDAYNGATVTVYGNIDAYNFGVYANGGATVNVGKSTAPVIINAVNEDAIRASGAGTTVTFFGDITGGDDDGIQSESGASVYMKGDISGTDYGVYVQSGGKITLDGNINVAYNGVYASDAGSVATVTGNIVAGQDGIFAYNGAKVYFAGTISPGGGFEDINIHDSEYFNVSDTPIRKNITLAAPYYGYYWDEFTDYTSYVYIRKGVISAPPSNYDGGAGSSVTTYTVSFNANGGSTVSSSSVNANGKLTKPADPTREGYDFAGWYTDAALTNAYDFDKAVTGGLTLYAKWTEKEKEEEKEPEPITPTMPVNPFSDVKGTDWFIDDVIYAYSNGLIDGTSPTAFSPNSNLTYAQAITLAARMHQLYTTGEVTLENDDDLWYQSYIDYAIENGIIGEDDDYDWSATATRAGYMQIFANALPDDAFANINDVPDGSIPDVPMDYPGAAAIYKLYRAGILQGNDAEHTCNPDGSIRRSEVAAILTRMMNPDARIGFSM